MPQKAPREDLRVKGSIWVLRQVSLGTGTLIGQKGEKGERVCFNINTRKNLNCSLQQVKRREIENRELGKSEAERGRQDWPCSICDSTPVHAASEIQGLLILK